MLNRLFPSLVLGSLLLLVSAAPYADEAITPAPPKRGLAYGFLSLTPAGDWLFSPCRDRSFIKVEDASGDGSVGAGLAQLGLKLGLPLYVELQGAVEGTAFKAEGLNFGRAEGRCQRPGGADENWRAVGANGDWQLAAGGDVVMLRRQAAGSEAGQRPATQSWPYRPFTPAGAPQDKQAIFESRSEDGTIRIELTRKLCADPAARVVTGWTARLTVNGETLQGCAWAR